MSRTPLLVLGLLLLAGGHANAQEANGVTPSVRTSCVSDYFRYCAGLNPAGGEVKACFREHIREVTPTCRAAIVAAFPEDARRYRARRPPT